MKAPAPGSMVHYQTDGRSFDYYLPAVVVVTLDNQNVEGLNTAGIPLVTAPDRAHLRVLSPGKDYVEYDVSYDSRGGRRTWRFLDDDYRSSLR